MQPNIQQLFMQQLKDNLPPNISLVDQLSDLLNISTDSAYRRIRNETQLTLEETQLLCSEFGLSLDALLNQVSHNITFHYEAIDEHQFNFKNYLETILADLEKISTFEEKEVIYIANDIPLFHLLQVPEIAAFKFFFWKKTILNFESAEGVSFGFDQRDEAIDELSRKIRSLYVKIPSIEVINAETIDSTLKQIEYYWESGYFEDPATAGFLCDKLGELVDHTRDLAVHGFKYIHGQKPVGREDTFKLYYNEVLHADNTILVKMDNACVTYVTSNGLNLMSTTSQRFFDSTYAWVKNLLSKCTLISGTSEKERNRVFRSYGEKIRQSKEKMQ